ncbi:hypothetical protein JQ595_37380 [Bradyrhizobium japonicum]|uniref:hypothetical protein n=1 Tax=Bradyrhizobium japonicum TaxID=375 RepID=UPI001BA67806|nr:hypothetical protein [Bradyrhizobium japonicum]MBR0734435.1 hypothetical protein [Bradyrhizobium japonicum]
MSKAVELVVELNSDWRVVVLPGAPWRRSKAWCLQQRVAGDWQGKHIVRSKVMLLNIVLGRAGPVDPLAAAVLEALPPRVDIRPAAKPKPAAVARTVRAAPVASIAPAVVQIPAKPDGIHYAAGRERRAIERARVDEERARAEERYWRGILK